MEKLTGSKLGKEFVKTVHCHPVYLTYMQSLVQFICSVVTNSLRPHGLQLTRLLHPWDFPGKRTAVGCHCPLQYGTLEQSNSSRQEVEGQLPEAGAGEMES